MATKDWLKEQKGDMVHAASHELKNMLAAIKALTQILQRRAKSKRDKESLIYLERIDSYVDKLTKGITKLIDMVT